MAAVFCISLPFETALGQFPEPVHDQSILNAEGSRSGPLHQQHAAWYLCLIMIGWPAEARYRQRLFTGWGRGQSPARGQRRYKGATCQSCEDDDQGRQAMS